MSVSPDRSTVEETCGSQTSLFSQESQQSSLRELDALMTIGLETADEALDFDEALMDVGEGTSMVSTYKYGGTTGWQKNGIHCHQIDMNRKKENN